MKRATALGLALPLLLCFAPRMVYAQQTTGPFANVPMTDQAYSDFQTIQDAGILLSRYPGGTIGSRTSMSGYDFAVAIDRLWLLLNRQTQTASADTAAFQHDAEATLQSHPLAQASLKRLVNEFQPELKGLGQDLPAIQTYLVALRPDLPPLPVSPPLPDVPKDHWAYQAVETLRKAGVVIGEGDGRFRG